MSLYYFIVVADKHMHDGQAHVSQLSSTELKKKKFSAIFWAFEMTNDAKFFSSYIKVVIVTLNKL